MTESSIHFITDDEIQSNYSIDYIDIKNYINSITFHYKLSLNILNFRFTSNSSIQSINQKFLHHDYPTDIITFPYNLDVLEADFIISLEMINQNVQEYNTTFNQELYRVIAHGILHLIGYNDQNETELKEMRSQEEICLSLHNVPRETN